MNEDKLWWRQYPLWFFEVEQFITGGAEDETQE